VNNSEERRAASNDVAESVIEAQRGLHDEWVLRYERRSICGTTDSVWKRPRVDAEAWWKVDKEDGARPGFAPFDWTTCSTPSCAGYGLLA
jgi:hypothetical protein